ncbi:MAG: transglutaminase domain-containing protein [Oscillospiraceae bacterium]|nr:transglutaminase domain-containing protein [Oscillospiraceae bacterium]
MNRTKRRIAAALTAATLAFSLTVPAMAAEGPQPEPYTISADHWSREDYSQEANPSVFTGAYDRELYNAIRQTMVDAGTQTAAPDDQIAYTMVAYEDYSAVKDLLGRLDGLYWHDHYVPPTLSNYWQYLDYFAVSATIPDEYKAVLDFIQPAVEKADGMSSEKEKAAYLNDYLCSLLEYDPNAVAAVTEVFAPHSGSLKGSCGTYARAFNLLCQAAGIPCFAVRTRTHSWNLVYADGAWGHVDVSSNDHSGRNGILLTGELPSRTDLTPEITAFLKEVLVPGSTK